MSRAARRLDAWLREPAPPRRLALVRLLVGAFALVFVLVRAGTFASWSHLPAAQFRPVGVVRILSAPLPEWATVACFVATVTTGLAFVMGWRFRPLAPLFALGLLWITSYRSSWGMIFHTENLLVLHVAVLSIAPAAEALAIDARGRSEREPAPRHGWPLRVMTLVTVATYVLSGVAKLREAGLGWAAGDQLLHQIAHDNARKILLGDVASPLGAWLPRNAWVFPPLAVFTLVVELGAPIALVGRTAARVWCTAAWAFHVGVLAAMAIFFPYPVLGFAFACSVDVDEIEARLRAFYERASEGRRRRRDEARPIAPSERPASEDAPSQD